MNDNSHLFQEFILNYHARDFTLVNIFHQMIYVNSMLKFF